jgi:hypothetical protein
MPDYTPGSAYAAGYKTRMNGGDKVSNTLNENSVYWQEWTAGWNDANDKIINEAREKATCSKPKCCKNKKFIQD